MYRQEKPLVPPLQFGLVDQGIYRGGYLKPISEAFIEKLKLKTIVSITPTPVDLHFLRDQSIHVVHVGISGADQYKSKKKRGLYVTDEQVCEVLAILENPENFPIYVHCLNGQQVTSLVIACFRMRQKWTVASAFAEFSRFIDYSRKEVAFVEWFEKNHCHS